MEEIKLWPIPGGRGKYYYSYDVTYRDTTLVRGSHDPEMDATRSLVKRYGPLGKVAVLDGPTGKHRSTVDTGKAQHMRTVERNRGGLSFERYDPNFVNRLK